MQDAQRLTAADGPTVGGIRREDVVHLGDVNDPGKNGDGSGLKPVRVASAVPPLVVVADRVSHHRQTRTVQDLLAQQRMPRVDPALHRSGVGMPVEIPVIQLPQTHVVQQPGDGSRLHGLVVLAHGDAQAPRDA